MKLNGGDTGMDDRGDDVSRIEVERLAAIGRAVLDKSDDRGFVPLDPVSMSACRVCNRRSEHGHTDSCPVSEALDRERDTA